MPTSGSSMRKAAPRQVTAKRRESIAAFEQWQRNWSASVHGPPPRREADANTPAKRAVTKHDSHPSAPHHSR